jgi:hypothetical protein
MTFAIGFLLLCFEPSKQLGPVDRLIVVRHDLKPHPIASQGMHSDHNVICWTITGEGDGLTFSPVESEWHACSLAFRLSSYRR